MHSNSVWTSFNFCVFWFCVKIVRWLIIAYVIERSLDLVGVSFFLGLFNSSAPNFKRLVANFIYLLFSSWIYLFHNFAQLWPDCGIVFLEIYLFIVAIYYSLVLPWLINFIIHWLIPWLALFTDWSLIYNWFLDWVIYWLIVYLLIHWWFIYWLSHWLIDSIYWFIVEILLFTDLLIDS